MIFLLVSKTFLGYEEALWPKKWRYKSCQSNFDKQLSDFGSFLKGNDFINCIFLNTGDNFFHYFKT